MNQIATTSFPPSYTLQVNARAKYPRLKMVPHKGLVVVIPVGFSKKHIPDLLKQHEEWIRKIEHHFEAHRQTAEEAFEVLPTTITFSTFNEAWQLNYHQAARNSVRLTMQGEGQLLLSGNIGETALCRQVLTKWLNRRADVLLSPRLTQLAASVGMCFSTTTMRCQQSRWGSCSSKGAITLNSKLLFLPEELVRHVMLHELCHTLHMNHSAAFWAEVARFDPQWKHHKREMKDAWKFVPRWLTAL
uniref:Zinc protease, putative n=1 Tax=Chlorobium chlorochromatii (strain CaD3) TaxID=340177 RepID=Q3AQA9_CHLCH